MTLCEFEVKVLRMCAGESVPGMAWGAAMGASLEALEGARLIARTRGVYTATDAGRLYLADMRGEG